MDWITPEFRHYEKKADWYIAVVIVALGIIVAETIIKDVILIILTILITVAFLLVSIRKPRDLHVAIETGGVRIQGIMHPYPSLAHFSIVESLADHKLILESTKRLSPYIIVPLADDVDPDEVRHLLGEKLLEADLREPLSHLIFERLGF